MNVMKQKVDILGVYVSPLTYKSTLEHITHLISDRKQGYICVAAVHLVMECQKNQMLRNGVNRATLVTPDGMPLVWIIRRNGYKTDRVYGPDLTLYVCQMAALKHYRVYLLGGSRGESRLLQEILEKTYPNLNIVGTYDTPVRPVSENENQQILRKINTSKAHIVFVGMGCPNQELWMIENRKYCNAPVLIGVGAAFDFITDKVRQAPKWMQESGLEWFYRFLQDPRRLWYRYFVLNIEFLSLILRNKILGYL